MAKKPPVYNCDIDQLDMISFQIDQFNIFNEGEDPLSDEQIGEYGYNLEVGIAYNLESKLVRVVIMQGIEIFEKKKTKKGDVKKRPNKNVGGKFTVTFFYSVGNLEECLVEGGKEEHLEKLLEATLIGLSYSTSRGIIKTKSANTILDEATLPIINPWSLVPE